jgi:hypothetical protein
MHILTSVLTLLSALAVANGLAVVSMIDAIVIYNLIYLHRDPTLLS